MLNFPIMVIFQRLPQALENLLQMAVAVWNAGKVYIILFVLFAVFCRVCNKKIRQRTYR